MRNYIGLVSSIILVLMLIWAFAGGFHLFNLHPHWYEGYKQSMIATFMLIVVGIVAMFVHFLLKVLEGEE